MTHQNFDALIALLEQEETIYNEMGLLLDEERTALLAMTIDRLGELAGRKETLALRIKALDESRKLLARRLGAAFGIEPSQITVVALCRMAPPETALRLSRIGIKLKETVKRCQSISDYNTRAAHKGMELVTGAIEYLIAQADPAGKLYQAPHARGAYPPVRRSAGPGFISRQV